MLAFHVDPLSLSLNAQEEMEKNRVFLTTFNYFEWKVKMVIQLRLKGLFRVTMGIETESNSVVEKLKYFNRLDEVFKMICLIILRDILFHVDSITTPNEL